MKTLSSSFITNQDDGATPKLAAADQGTQPLYNITALFSGVKRTNCPIDNKLYLFRTLGNSSVSAECKGGPDESAKVSD